MLTSDNFGFSSTSTRALVAPTADADQGLPLRDPSGWWWGVEMRALGIDAVRNGPCARMFQLVTSPITYYYGAVVFFCSAFSPFQSFFFLSTLLD